MSFNTEKEWETKAGFLAVAVRTDMGHLCGYVGVPRSHPLYGKNYSANLKCLDALYKKAMTGPIGKRGALSVMCAVSGRKSMDIVFNVHGSVTFSGNGKGLYPVACKPMLWWIGFDCAHCDDNPIVCNLAFVTKECESLADQIKLVK